MSTWSTALEAPDGRLLIQFDCCTEENPDVQCQVMATTWHGDRLMAAIMRPDGVLRVVDATTLKYKNK
jgi:hypothetical protein